MGDAIDLYGITATGRGLWTWGGGLRRPGEAGDAGPCGGRLDGGTPTEHTAQERVRTPHRTELGAAACLLVDRGGCCPIIITICSREAGSRECS